MCIHDKSCKIKDEIQQKYNLDAKLTAEYEKYVPKIQLLFLFDHICVKSDDWFNATVGNVPRKIYDRVNAEELHEKIKSSFRWFKIMVCSMLGREIQRYLPGMERAFFRDSGLVAIKTDFEQRITIPTFELKKWVQRVSNKTKSSGVSNPDYIPGMDVLAKHDLTRIGFFAQAFVTKKLYEGGKLKVLGVEKEPIHPGTNPNGKEYDVDIWLECDGVKIPVQVGVRVGELAWNVSDATICPGEEIKPNSAISEFGGTDMNFGKEPDFQELCEKLDQTPLGGMVLWITSEELLPGSGLRPLKEWYSGMMNKKCVLVWFPDENKAYIHHNNTGFDLTLAKKVCDALGVTKSNTCADSYESLTDNSIFDDRAILRHLAHISGYSERFDDVNIVLKDHLVPILRHVVDMYKKTTTENSDNGEKWQRHVYDALSILQNMAENDNVKLDTNVWIDACNILQDIASERHDDYSCETLSYNEIENRLHLQALFCLTCVVYRLGDKTPSKVQEILTGVARFDGQEGIEHRIVLGYSIMKLRSAIPNWYTKNESLLFGDDSPCNVSSVLMRICLNYNLLDEQTMEKYHTAVLEALNDEILCIRQKAENLESNDLVRCFMSHVLRGSHRYDIEDLIRNLARIGPDAVSVACHECGHIICQENTDKKYVERGVQFWETLLDSSLEPVALYGLGWWALANSIDQDTWEQLMLRTCEATNGLVEIPDAVIERASLDENPTKSGKRIIDLVQNAPTDAS